MVSSDVPRDNSAKRESDSLSSILTSALTPSSVTNTSANPFLASFHSLASLCTSFWNLLAGAPCSPSAPFHGANSTSLTTWLNTPPSSPTLTSQRSLNTPTSSPTTPSAKVSLAVLTVTPNSIAAINLVTANS